MQIRFSELLLFLFWLVNTHSFINIKLAHIHHLTLYVSDSLNPIQARTGEAELKAV